MFETLELDDELCRAVAEMGFSKPTSIQKEAIPAALDGADVLASAPTGTGKTAAFLLPASQFLLDFPKPHCEFARILVLTPTRELALQVYEQAKAITAYTGQKVGVIIGGINYGTDHAVLDEATDIIIATPGRLFEHIEQERFDCRELEWLILDEADRMLDMGFGGIVQQICSEARWRKQTLLFSATLNSGDVRRFAHTVLKNPVEVSASPSRKERPKILQWVHYADDLQHKDALLEHILRSENMEKAIVFVKTRERLHALSQKLHEVGLSCSAIRGEMPQDKRIAALEQFKSGQTNILVATDVAARGIDIPEVSHAINYDLPRTADVYVHRIGRTGRSGNKGIAISLVEAHDMTVLDKIRRYTDEPIKPQKIAGLEPKHKVAKIPSKKPKKKKAKKKK
ncbi:MAG: ATP-dependent RNA helicase SrmB [Alteromonadaceae bacterium]|nr:ATP-dependent RNA helicase SrmB [Alteromonadaceae bacterium]